MNQVNMCVYIDIRIYIYIERERERERKDIVFSTIHDVKHSSKKMAIPREGKL